MILKKFYEPSTLILAIQVFLLGSLSQVYFGLLSIGGYSKFNTSLSIIAIIISMINIRLLLLFLNRKIEDLFDFSELKVWRNWSTMLFINIFFYIITALGTLLIEKLGLLKSDGYNSLIDNLPNYILIFQVYMLAPIAEEFSFRYILVGKYKKSTKMALIISSTAFSLGHSPTNLVAFAVYFIMGLTLGKLYLCKKSFTLNICTHAIWNFLAVFVL